MRFPSPDPSLLEIRRANDDNEKPWVLHSNDPIWLKQTAGHTGIVGRFKTRSEAEDWRSLNIAVATKVWARECGDCHACCTPLAVPELDKPGGTPCRHLTVLNEARCGIYETRPSACSNYFCGWRFGLGGMKDRPDRLGLVLSPRDNREDTGLPLDNVSFMAHELWPGAAGAKAGRRYLSILKDLGLVVFLILRDMPHTLAKPELLAKINDWLERQGLSDHMEILADYADFKRFVVQRGVSSTP